MRWKESGSQSWRGAVGSARDHACFPQGFGAPGRGFNAALVVGLMTVRICFCFTVSVMRRRIDLPAKLLQSFSTVRPFNHPLHRNWAGYGVSVDDPSDARTADTTSSGPRRARATPTPSRESVSDLVEGEEPSLGKSDLLLDTPDKVWTFYRGKSAEIFLQRHSRPLD
jgi:hypothetical protein